ncbi:bifunctional [glutamate--ammonia ligase]-adenylyl-L-tyrosine phosphorylase/[glutamate--ammonia-ligase] adenylyltransferase [Hahella sp. HN01]|uniref:bifunctional [glutamate--ammonia ligase]-adenylyl-L-tyrosine phosphorylase/[glutamate--ammonia-ligase] adenylyltransferase n=1 Tax=Hahella sp. HN01 TaxID=2847262 RepID=UPI001C1EE33B|nr:bifunctional [glutamate--ammonia ligase]-adenylyl-L-tyrosine phosphorylase/[glutamate--ammonia-ligase] adenylyltransferase [Hahella sp. HN01]MBU6951589.1 bifunctional [glutamate--ammonia ligase]-adenylyl-L-tyrosine phosphorylase/[glutamate--ammonia-ligase] adenylyltransferase [Hahella sp. HN01]
MAAPSELDLYPSAIHPTIRKYWGEFATLPTEIFGALSPFYPDILRAFAVSDFLALIILREPELALSFLQSSQYQKDYQFVDFRALLAQELSEAHKEDDLLRILRQFRRRMMFRVIWRDLVCLVDYQVTAREVSWLAETCIDEALSWIYRDLSQQFGEPHSEAGDKQQLVVLAMGKLGASELNVSSDIDLIFTFPERGETQGAPRSLDNQAFFTRLGQRLIQALDKTTADGFVFRVDMRLRPYGQSGALALSFAAMEAYYQEQGRDWERYAMIKARAVAGDIEAGEELLTSLKPFVYRKYIDFGAIQALRAMKEMIEREVQRKGQDGNIKVGRGGIREIEFIVQVFQLMRGGRDVRLQQRNLLSTLECLEDEGLLPVAAAAELREAYIFLRNIEHAIQGLDDKQTQEIPTDEVERERVAVGMGFPGWGECRGQLDKLRDCVTEHFADIIAERREAPLERPDTVEWRALWAGRLTLDEAQDLLSRSGCEQAIEIYESVKQLLQSSRVQHMQLQGRERLDEFMPNLLQSLAESRASHETCRRLLALVEAVLRRSAYLALLNENPGALSELIRLFAESAWISTQIVTTPLLLDELLHTGSLYTPPDTSSLRDELRQQMLRIPNDGLEEQMEALRYFKKAHVLRVAASDLRETLPLMKVSDYLTFIAETIVEQVVDEAWETMVKKYGEPGYEDAASNDMRFAVIGYGKLGGIEMSYGSDLDLVFLHGASGDLDTNGETSIANQVFFTRLGQRIIHLLTTKTASGDIYEVDMRLRPSGNSGLLVSSVSAFQQYQEKSAWTWEHQALVRSRAVAGCPSIRAEFEKVRKEILTQSRDPVKLRAEVIEMREKMSASLGTKSDSSGSLPYFDLKHDRGGIVDIEFMVQYAALRWANEFPQIVAWSDNIRILEALGEAGIFTPEDAEKLCDIYRLLRARGHRLALQNLPARIQADELLEECRWVVAFWEKVFAE